MAKFSAKHQEESLQQACVQWFQWQFPKYNKCLFHVQQKAKNAIEGAKFKKNGVVAGVSDLVLASFTGTCFIELKTDKGKQTDEQKEFQSQIEALCMEYVVIRNLEEFISYVSNKMKKNYTILDHE